MRGASVFGERLAIANAESVTLFDAEWRAIAQTTHPLVGGAHEILAEERGVWITSTVADLLVQLDWQGRLLDAWEWRADEALRAALGFGRVPRVDRGLDYRDPRTMRTGARNLVHLNAVARGPDGLIVSLGRVLAPAALRRAMVNGWIGRAASALGVPPRRSDRVANMTVRNAAGRIGDSSSALVQLAADGARVLRSERGTVVPNHNVYLDQRWLAFNDTNRSEFVIVGRRDGAQMRVRVPGEPGFVRGLAPWRQRYFFVGAQSPASVHMIDAEAGSVERSYDLGGELNESVFGVCVLPEVFVDPPERLDWGTGQVAR